MRKKSPMKNSSLKLCPALAAALLLNCGAVAGAAEMVIENPDGPVTTHEIAAFKAFMQSQPADGDNNHNHWVYGSGGKNIEALGMVYEISGDREILDQMIRFADAALAARNDPTNGRIIWTGKRELCWPNAKTNSATAKYSGSENGDVIAHIAYCAELILKTPMIWAKPVGLGDPHGYGATYKERALAFVREMDRSEDTFILPWFVSASDMNHYRWPDSPLYTFNKGGTPIPWNQQTMLSGGFLRLAECHEILNDDPARAKKFYSIIGANMNWFLGDLHPYERDGHTVYDWGYSLGRKSEDVPHGGYDIWGLCRAFESGKFNMPAGTMTNFASTLFYVIWDPTNKTFHMRVDATDGKKSPRRSIAASWTLLAQYFPNSDLYHLVADANRATAKTRPLEAAFILYLKNHRYRESSATANNALRKGMK
jgi:hypothetical protein